MPSVADKQERRDQVVNTALRVIVPDALAGTSILDAERLGLKTGDKANLKTRVETLVASVEVMDRLVCGVVCLPHGWGHDLPGVKPSVPTRRPGVSSNRIIDEEAVDVPSGTSVLNGVPV
jgi:anaerobic selenocysteine-containing dehydrogenase